MKASTCLGLLAALVPAMATITFTQPDSTLTFELLTQTSGSSTDLHFNMSIPASNGWGGIGVGDQMAGALMFILLPDKTNGSTISVRSAPSEVMPTALSGVNFEVVSGSADNGVLSAQGICHGCQTWNGGSLNPTSTSQSFIWAVGPGTSGVMGTGANAVITQHSIMGTFNANLVQAAQQPASSGSSSSGGSGGSSSGGDSSSGGSPASSGVTGGAIQLTPKPMLIVAHATIFILAFLLLFPLGVTLLRIPGVGKWQVHAGIQTIATILVIAGLAIGVTMSRGTIAGGFDTPHQRIGIAAASLVFFQYLAGIVHHIGYRRFQKRWAVTWVHFVVGPIAMVLGVINPILGFLETEMRPAAIGVGVVGVFIWFATFGFAWAMDATSAKRSAGKSTGSESDERVVDMVQK